MSLYYADTSAIVKLYVNEVGSDWLRNQIGVTGIPSVVSSQLLQVEMWSAFARRMREETVTATEYRDICQLFDRHRHTLYRLVTLNEAIMQLARDLIERYPLRGYDAVHLATALNAHCRLVTRGRPGLTFLSADDHLNEAADAEGLAVDNPNQHP